jgi:hypothetical protein
MGRAVLVAFAVGAVPAALLGGVSCSPDPVGLDIPVGTGGTSPIGDERPDLQARCGENGTLCGEGCCLAGNICSADDRCIPDTACTTSEDCASDSQCAANRCQPWTLQPAARQFDQSCRTSIELPDVVPTVQCQWPGNRAPSEFPNSVQVIGTPMVVDFDADGDPTTSHPSIVFVSYEGSFQEATGVLRVIDGEDCSLQATIQGVFGFTPEVPVALGDINGDGKPDIVAADEEQLQAAVVSGVAAFEPGDGPSLTFSEIGRVRSAGTGIIKGFALHDIDNNQVPEIFTEKTMLRVDPNQGLINVTALQLPNRPELTALEPPTIMDLDGDFTAEVVTPQGIFTWDTLNTTFVDKTTTLNGSEVLWDNEDDFGGFFMGMANLGEWETNLPSAVDSAELLVIGPAGEIQIKTINGTTRFRMGTAGLAGGPPVIADVDGDGRMEFASGGFDKLTVFDLDCTPAFWNERGCMGGRGTERANGVIWEADTKGARSGVAMFDFDGDGRTEVVYADQCFMRVYDGQTGDVLFSTPRSSTTQWEYPVVADTDGDGYSELVTTSNDNDTFIGANCDDTDLENKNATVNFALSHGVTVWKERDDRWAGSRPIWNQHNYFVVNVNDDGTIPPMGEVQSLWEDGGPNTFRKNVQGATGRSLALADLTTAGDPSVDCNPNRGIATLTVGVCNRGANALRAEEAEIALRDQARPTQILCQQRNPTAIASGSCIEINCDIPITPGGAPIDVMIMGDPTEQVNECYEANNLSFIQRVSCAPAGPN